jgi:hypothetical protein
MTYKFYWDMTSLYKRVILRLNNKLAMWNHERENELKAPPITLYILEKEDRINYQPHSST